MAVGLGVVTTHLSNMQHNMLRPRLCCFTTVLLKLVCHPLNLCNTSAAAPAAVHAHTV